MLQIRDAAEPYALGTPTVVAGTVDSETGAITRGSLSTPPVSFETEALGYPVYVDAVFTEVDPETGTGSIDHQGNVLFQTRLSVDLHIEVDFGSAPSLVADCHSTPVALTLESSSPYDPATGRVTLVDTDFAIPPVEEAGGCGPPISTEVNKLLRGSGHSLTLGLAGEVVLPPAPGCPTSTALAAAPVDGARLGAPVTLVATVTPDAGHPLCTEAAGAGEVPAGFVELRDGAATIDTVPLDADGTATLTTTDLPAGSRALSARFVARAPYSSSASPVTTYRISAPPGVAATVPPYVQVGAAPVEVDVTATNTGFGADVVNARLDVTVRRAEGSGSLTPAQIALEHLGDDGTWVPVVLTAAGATRFGTIGGTTGAPLPVGQAMNRRLRIAFDGAVPPGPVELTFELVPVDPVLGTPSTTPAPSTAALARVQGRTTLVEATRREGTISVGNRGSNPVQPHTVRQGQTARLNAVSLGPVVNGVRPSGYLEVFLDGVQVDVWDTPAGAPEDGYVRRLPLTGAASFPSFRVPSGLAAGTHTVMVRTSGDAIFRPVQWEGSIHVLPAAGATYRCSVTSVDALFNSLFTVNVVAQANVPASSPAGELDLDHLDVRIVADRGPTAGTGAFNTLGTGVTQVGQTIGASTLNGIAMSFGPGGTGTATATERINSTMMADATRPVDPAPDQVIALHGEAGTVSLAGAPGEVVPVTLDSLVIDTSFAFPRVFECVPEGDPVVLGEVTVEGVSLVASPGGPVRHGDAVALTATVAPAQAGMVEFRDGDTTLGVVMVDDEGTATITTDAIAAGTRSITAVFYRASLGPALRSAPVELVVQAIDCAGFTDEGAGAVVRLVYLELLGRCPDQGGYDHWVGRLDGGTSREAFARSIARTPEAVGQVVDDAYETMLGRAPDAAGRAFWVRRLQASGRYDVLLADLAASGEFWAKAGSTDAGFVTRVYERLLGRAPDAGGLDYWVGRLASGTSRRSMVRTLANLDEPLGRVVALSYDEILDRAPQASERTAGVAHLRATGDRSALYAQLIGRPEFATRAGKLPNATT